MPRTWITLTPALAALLTACATAVEPPAPAPAVGPRALPDPAPPARVGSNDAWTRRFVDEKLAYLAQGRAVLEALGAAGELAPLRDWARQRLTPTRGQDGITYETRRALNDAFAEEAAMRMAAYGFTARQVAALHARGVDVAAAFAHWTRDPSPLRSAATRAEAAVVAEVVDVDAAEDLGDGALSTARFRVVETLKGDVAPGVIYELRLPGGRDAQGRQALGPAGATEPDSLAPGDRFVLFPSPARYRFEARLKGAQPQPARPRLTFNETEPIRLRGEMLSGTHTTPVGSLEQLRSELAPLARAWRDAGR